jgi:WD40 repeat protein
MFGKTLKLLTGHTYEVRSLAVLLDGTLASCSYDGTIRIWDINNRQTIKILNGTEGISSLAVFPDGT